ncbi:MAG: D-alanyl-D-alanine carboxypeptidase [Alphaproteobacteria bacterium]|nr:D-alanyl-D-alanine carboxypeptidase [Alphaproteobacteria bacterium]
MKKQNFIIFIMALCLSFGATPASAASHHAHHHHTRHHPHPWVQSGDNPRYADIVIDADTGRIIHETDPNGLRHPASLTKMMTLYLTFEALESGRLRLDQYVPVSLNASQQSPSKLGLRPGQSVKVEDLILGMVTKSANDAAVTMGETLGGSEAGFAKMMMAQARALGMSRTVYRNPSGLPNPDQVTTAHDMAILGDALVHHFPEYYHYFNCDGFTFEGIYRHTHNHLKDRYPGMDGIKTGYIRASGFNLVASVKRNGIRLIGVVFGGTSAVERDNHMAQLLDAAFAKDEADIREARIDKAQGQGDADADAGDAHYVTLPAKIAAVFPPRNLAPAQAVPAQPEHASVTVVQPAAVPDAAHRWGIQIGAYSDPAIGRQALASLVAELPDRLGQATPQIDPVAVAGTQMYRARLMNMDQQTAQGMCSYLVRRSKSCLTVAP